MKKKLLPILSLLLLFCLCACSTKPEKNFEYDEGMMINMTKAVVNKCYNVSGAQAEYILKEGENVEKTAVAGFQQAQTTDKVGEFQGYDTSEDVTTFENGAKGDVLCSIIVKFDKRDVRVTVSFEKNLLYDAWVETPSYQQSYEQEMGGLQQYAENAGYSSADEFVKNEASFQQLGYRTTSAEDFIKDYLCQNNNIYPYKALETEVSAVYSTSELLLNGAKNMGVGMGVVFVVLIFIACIIYLLRFVPKLLGKEKKSDSEKKPAAAKPKAAAPIPTGPAAIAQAAKASEAVSTGEEVTDGELIAVITAALHAYLADGSTGEAGVIHPPAYTASNDKLVVRSIRRVR